MKKKSPPSKSSSKQVVVQLLRISALNHSRDTPTSKVGLSLCVVYNPGMTGATN